MVLIFGEGATLVLLAVTCSVLGRILTTTVSFPDRLERIAITSILGLAATAQILNLFGLAGVLNRGIVLTFFGVTLAIGAGVLARRAALLANHPAVLTPAPTIASTGVAQQGFLILGFVFVFFAPLLVLASYPPVAFDETLYHLPFARAFVRTGALPFLPELRVPVFPPLTELLFAGMLLFFNDLSTHLVSLLAVILTALLLVVWGKRESSWRAGALAAAIYLGNPIVTQLSSTAYDEPVLTLFVTAALYSVWRYWADRSSAWLVLAAFLSATAAGTKYLGLFFVPTAFILLMLPPGKGVRVPRLRTSALFCVVAAATLLPVYARIVYFTGNPLFPFLPCVFGSSLWNPAPSPYSTIAARLVGTITLPWKAVFEPAAAGRQAPVSPFVLLLSPLLLCAWARQSAVRALLVACVVFAFAVPPDARYLMPVLPIVCLALSLALEQVPRWAVLPARSRTRQNQLFWICCGILLLPGWLYAGRAIFNRGIPPVGNAERDFFLSRQLPAYRAIEVLNKAFGTRFTVYAVHAENLVYWSEGTLLGDWTGPASFAQVLPRAGNPAGLFCKLRELGAGYLLVTKGHPDFPLATADSRFSARFRRIYEDETSELFALSPADLQCLGADPKYE
ncbi:MAG: ArnT family glycosyltransferase [Candidatus Binataceae bacterium]